MAEKRFEEIFTQGKMLTTKTKKGERPDSPNLGCWDSSAIMGSLTIIQQISRIHVGGVLIVRPLNQQDLQVA